MKMKRIMAWIALIFLLFIIINILFIHIYVTESVVVFLLYVLVFYFGVGRRSGSQSSDFTSESNDDDLKTSDKIPDEETNQP